MIKNFSLNWNDGKGEKSIRFDFGYDYETCLLKADITLNGESQIAYNSQHQLPNDEWLANKYFFYHTLMNMVIENLIQLDSLPVANEIDPRILSVSNALINAVMATENGQVFWLGEGEASAEQDEACPFLDEMA